MSKVIQATTINIFGENVFIIDNFLNPIEKFLMCRDGKYDLKNNRCVTTDDDYRPNIQTTRNFLSRHSNKKFWTKFENRVIVISKKLFDMDSIYTHQSWFLQIDKECKTDNYFHTHKTAISGVFYFKVPEKQVGLIFKNKFNSMIEIEAVENRVILFPGYLTHAPNQKLCCTNKPRYSFAFDLEKKHSLTNFLV